MRAAERQARQSRWRGREPTLMTDARARTVVGKDRCDERTARRLFAGLATRYADLAEHLW
jgi:hypothetical protein